MNDFTLIIPTHNRHHYLKRSIEYFKELDAMVIYCDSSLIKYAGVIPSNIEYLHLPNLKFAEKILKAISLVSTSNIALCADDDFILIESLYKGDAFLNSNGCYSTVVGQYIGFKKDFDGFFFKMYKWRDRDNDINYDALDNAKTFFSNYHQILWAMYRKEMIQSAFELISKSKFKNDNFIELSIGALACFKGGIKIFNFIWGVREINNDDHWALHHLPLGMIQKKKLNVDFTQFKMSIDAVTFDGYSDVVMSSYLDNQSKHSNSIKRKIKNIIPNSIVTFLKKYLYQRNDILNPIEKKYSVQFEKIRFILLNQF
ncbi:MAG: TIGR00180 family glycosyltransferase [Tissierellia bacterium]|nr:TIGR00180 family glycosyltransferase [Tissierellia bacterium]